MAKVVIPTLETTTFLSDPVDKIAYILRQFAAMPKSASDLYHREMISLVDITSKYGHQREQTEVAVYDALMSVYVRLFGAGNVQVTVTTENLSGGRYNLVIAVRAVEDGQSYGLTGNITVSDEGQLQFTIRTGV